MLRLPLGMVVAERFGDCQSKMKLSLLLLGILAGVARSALSSAQSAYRAGLRFSLLFFQILQRLLVNWQIGLLLFGNILER